ncbi:MAG: CBS domain-containing protein [candidate division Zixibacteria bacterium]
MTVRELLKTKSSQIVTTSPKESVKAAMSLLIERKISCLPVVDEGARLIGIISDKDIFVKLYETEGNFKDCTVGEIMSSDLIIGLPDDEVSYVAGLMTNNRIRHIPVLEADKLIGLVSVGDVVKTQMENIKVENRYLKSYIEGTYPG